MRVASQVLPSQIAQAQAATAQPPPPPQKGSIMTGFPMRTQAAAVSYQSASQVIIRYLSCAIQHSYVLKKRTRFYVKFQENNCSLNQCPILVQIIKNVGMKYS